MKYATTENDFGRKQKTWETNKHKNNWQIYYIYINQNS